LNPSRAGVKSVITEPAGRTTKCTTGWLPVLADQNA
jgi:hypothetical protein